MKNQPGSESGEDFDVRRVHGQLVREKSEPWELFHSIPAWLKHGIYAPLVIWGVWYLIVASGGFHWDEFNEGPRSTVREAEFEAKSNKLTARIAPKSPDQNKAIAAPPATLQDQGKTVYQSVCFACHQPDGNGLPGAFPPLAGSEWVAGDDRPLALIVLHGLMGPIEVKGQPWNGVMPPQGASLSDKQIAAVLTYIRSEWGNSAPEVSPETVAKMRKEFEGHAPWTASSLQSEAPK